MEMSKNVTFLTKIDTTVKNIMKDGKIDEFDIPEILLLITDLVATSEQKKMTLPQLEESIKGDDGKQIAFFDKGISRDWSKTLDKNLSQEIEKCFKNEMTELGYL